MDFKFFKSLGADEAKAYLQRFLEVEGAAIESTIAVASAQGLDCDWSVASLPNFLKWILSQLSVTPVKPDPSVPKFIRDTDVYKRGLFRFDESSKALVMRSAYYMGESFVRHSKALSWSTGNVDFAQGNMPVVTGFKFSKELPPIMVVENMFRGILGGGSSDATVDIAIDAWLGNTPLLS